MNRAEVVDAIVKSTGVSKKDTEAVLKAFIDTTESAVKKGVDVTLIGFGTFKQTKRAARKARNPQTGEMIKIGAKKAVTFKAGKAFKDFVNGVKKEEKPAKPTKKSKK